MRKWIVLVLVLIMGFAAIAKQSERSYQEQYCKGLIEWRLSDGSRVDCLTKDYAIEFDFSHKWAEAIGQSLFYSIQTGKAPAVFLIDKGGSADLHFRRLESVNKRFGLGIKVWRVSE